MGQRFNCLSSSRLKKRPHCEGCNETFSRKFFKRHLKENFDEATNTYKCAQLRKESTSESDVEATAWDGESVDFAANDPESNSSADEAANRQMENMFEARKRFSQQNLNESDLRNFFDQHESPQSETESSDEDCDIHQDQDIWVEDQELQDLVHGSETDNHEIPVKEDTSSYFCGIIIRWLCLFIAQWQTNNVVSDTAIGNLLKFLSAILFVISSRCSFLEPLANEFPKTIRCLHSYLDFGSNSFKKFVVCPSCFTLYEEKDCFYVNRGVRHPAKCKYIAFPNHRQRHLRQPCSAELMRQSTAPSGKKVLVPYKIYCYNPLKESLQKLFKRTYFEEQCQLWKDRSLPANVYEDIYDGKVWEKFSPFFNESPRNIGLMLNLDWFDPYKHASYSVGVIYMVCLNLPRSERFKRKNVILVGIIPHMKHEPPTNTFLLPLVEELKKGWSDGFLINSSSSPNSQVICKVALLCVGCDIPACRKLCGFLGKKAVY